MRMISRLEDEWAPWQWEVLFDLLEGRSVVAYIHGEAYSVSVVDGAHHLWHLHTGKQYTVQGEFCSCPDSRFRKHICKHILRIRQMTVDI